MTSTPSWLRKARTELDGLLAQECACPLAPADAYRALVLLARLRHALETAAPVLSAEELHALATRCALPHDEELLTALDEALCAGGEAAGELLDAVLDVEDQAGVLGLLGREPQSFQLVGQAAALISLSPERVLPLFEFATERAAALRPDTPVAELWRAVHEASAEIAASLLPSPEALPPEARRSLERIRRVSAAEIIRIPLLELPRVAARSRELESVPLVDASGRPSGASFVDPETGRRMVEHRLHAGDIPTPRIWLHALDRASGRSLGREELDVERDGRDIYISLGADVGPGSMRHQLARRLGVRLEEIDLELRSDDV
jgi:hypothetical protein